MRFFEHKLSLGVVFIALPLLFLPKINLISFNSETAGLRIDDMVLFFIGALLMWSHAYSHQRLYKVEGWLLLLTAFSFLSFFSNRLLVSSHILYMDAKIFYTIRLLEYFIFFYIGAIASQYFRDSTIVRAFFLWNLVLMILQKLNLAGAITVTGYSTDVSTRVHGIASFPSEMGLLINLIFCYLIFDRTTRSQFVRLFSSPWTRYLLGKFYLYWMFALCGTLVIFTGNRVSIVALLVCFLWRLKEEFSLRSIGSAVLAMISIPFIIAGVFFLVVQTASVYERSADLFSYKNLGLAQMVWEQIDLSKSPVGNEIISATDYDMSWWMRIHKWVHVLKAYITHPECYLQGLGPGFAWAALDGGLLRILVEYGVIGTFLFWKFFRCLYRINEQIKWMMVAFLLNMIFFDAYLAYKTMSLLFFLCGYAFERQQRSAQIRQYEKAEASLRIEQTQPASPQIF